MDGSISVLSTLYSLMDLKFVRRTMTGIFSSISGAIKRRKFNIWTNFRKSVIFQAAGILEERTFFGEELIKSGDLTLNSIILFL